MGVHMFTATVLLLFRLHIFGHAPDLKDFICRCAGRLKPSRVLEGPKVFSRCPCVILFMMLPASK